MPGAHAPTAPSIPFDPVRGVIDPKVKIYQVGTLRYTLAGLVTLFGWLLWGDFCYILLELVIPRLLPLYMKDLQASNRLIGIMMGSVPGLLNFIFLPALGVWSDRHRGRLGRRRPFLLVTSPLTAMVLILIGFYPELGGWLHEGLIVRFLEVSRTGVLLITLCGLTVVFYMFNLVMATMYNCLVIDVVPQEVMGRFLSLFRAVATAGGFFFSRYLFGLGETHRRGLFLGVGLIYVITFLIMCWRVKEGGFPPIESSAPKLTSWKMAKVYFRECFSIPLYLSIFVMTTLIGVSYCTGPFLIFFYRDQLGMTVDAIGKYMGWIYLLMSVCCLPMGYLCDKIHPVRATVIGLTFMFLVHLGSFFWVVSSNSLLVCGVTVVIPTVAYLIGSSASAAVLFPREKYGQYNAAMGMLGALGVIVGNVAIGSLFDYVQEYRTGFLVLAVCELLAMVCGVFMYYGWIRHGGPKHYIPPLSGDKI